MSLPWYWWLILGLLIGFIAEWIVDWLHWRKRRTETITQTSEADPAAVANLRTELGGAHADIERLNAELKAALADNARLDAELKPALADKARLEAELNAAGDSRHTLAPLAAAAAGGVVLGEAIDDSDDLRKQIVALQAELDAERATGHTLVFAERDPLIDINGVGPVYEQKLFDAGVYSFAQVSEMTPQQIRDIIKPESWQEIDPEAWIAESKLLHAKFHPDPLIDINGIGPVYEQKLFGAGIYTFDQLANSTPEQIRAIVKPEAWQATNEQAWIAEAKTMADRKASLAPGRALAVGGGVALGASMAGGDTAQLRADLEASQVEAAQLRADLEAERSTSHSLRFAQRDPLIDINGVGPVYEQKLFDGGVYTFEQLSLMTPQQVRDIVQPEAWQEIDPEAWIAEAKLMHTKFHPDPLIDINGIGPVYEQKLFDAGVYTFDQLANSTPEQIRAIVKPQAWQETNEAAWIAEAKTRAAHKASLAPSKALAVGGGVVLGASAAGGDTAQLRADLGAARAEAAQLRADLEAERSTSRSLRFAQRDPLIDINGVGPVYEQKLFDAGIYTFAELAALTPQQIRDIVKPEAWQEIDPEAWIAESKSLHVSRHRDPLVDIDGIGPIYEQKLFDAGIYTFEQLAASTPEAIRDIIQPQAWQEVDSAAWIAEAADFARKLHSGGR